MRAVGSPASGVARGIADSGPISYELGTAPRRRVWMAA